MLISIEHRLAYLAVPKTGSTSIEEALSPFCDIIFTKKPAVKHMTARRFHWHMRKYLNAIGHEDVALCALIREPIEWLGSWYRYRARPQMRGKANDTSAISFEDFALAYMEEPRPEFAAVGQQSVFLSLPKDAKGVEFLFAYEALDVFGAFLSDRIGRKITFDRLNTSPKSDLTLSEATHASLTEYFHADYELWRAARRTWPS